MTSYYIASSDLSPDENDKEACQAGPGPNTASISEAPKSIYIGRNGSIQHGPDKTVENSAHSASLLSFRIRRSTLWLGIALILVIACAVIGGGLGGSVAVKHAKAVSWSQGVEEVIG